MIRRASADRFVDNIRSSGLSIYDSIPVGDPDLWIPAPELELILTEKLVGLDLAGLPLRTRSKVVKASVCKALGYPVPSSFRKTQPRFPGQNFDTYVQKSSNLQIWNEEISSSRRYVLIGVNEYDKVRRIRVETGDTIARLDTTGTLTQKYQARFLPTAKAAELVTPTDTARLRAPAQVRERSVTFAVPPTAPPSLDELLPIAVIFDRLSSLIGVSFADTGSDQERNRGAALHQLVCKALGYVNYADDGRFPDVRHQLLEVKLQTSPTIDLGLVCPDDDSLLDVTQLAGGQVRHCDVRYAVFFATIAGGLVTIRNLVLTTGEKFFTRFTRFEGKVLNKKLQIPLPRGFLDG